MVSKYFYTFGGALLWNSAEDLAWRHEKSQNKKSTSENSPK